MHLNQTTKKTLKKQLVDKKKVIKQTRDHYSVFVSSLFNTNKKQIKEDLSRLDVSLNILFHLMVEFVKKHF